MDKVSISDFLDTDYKKFAFYVIENRSIPSFCDGLKPVQRKILFALSSEKGEKLKVNVLSGKVIFKTQYHHGNVSVEDAVVNMAQKFKNNLPMLEEIGIYGSLRNPYASSSRYIATKISKLFEYVFKDSEILEYVTIDGVECEPKYYLPIIPMILINGGSGIAVGFSMNILNRNPISIIDNCINLINGKKLKDMNPEIHDFTGSFTRDKDNHKRWIIKGRYELSGTTLKILEIPPSFTYENYESVLDKLVDDKSIVSYKNNSKSNIDYTVKLPRGKALSEEDIFKTFKLVEYSTEIFTTLDELGKLKMFDSDEEIIRHFVDFRLGYYQKRKDFLINKITQDLKLLRNRGRFIKLILDGKVIINNKPKSEIVSQLESTDIEKIEEDYDYLLKMPIHSLTKETFEKIKEDFTSKKSELEKVKLILPKDMYIEDLNNLKIKLKEI